MHCVVNLLDDSMNGPSNCLSHLRTHGWLEVELVVLAVELPVDPAAVVAVPAQEAVDLPPAVVIVPPVAAAVAVRTGKTKFNT